LVDKKKKGGGKRKMKCVCTNMWRIYLDIWMFVWGGQWLNILMYWVEDWFLFVIGPLFYISKRNSKNHKTQI
jgi:hypothetical protein